MPEWIIAAPGHRGLSGTVFAIRYMPKRYPGYPFVCTRDNQAFARSASLLAAEAICETGQLELEKMGVAEEVE